MGYIAEAYLETDYRGKGMASKLFKKAIEWFEKKNITWITVSTHSLDKGAISFWEHKGLKEFNKFFKLECKGE